MVSNYTKVPAGFVLIWTDFKSHSLSTSDLLKRDPARAASVPVALWTASVDILHVKHRIVAGLQRKSVIVADWFSDTDQCRAGRSVPYWEPIRSEFFPLILSKNSTQTQVFYFFNFDISFLSCIVITSITDSLRIKIKNTKAIFIKSFLKSLYAVGFLQTIHSYSWTSLAAEYKISFLVGLSHSCWHIDTILLLVYMEFCPNGFLFPPLRLRPIDVSSQVMCTVPFPV